uniref:Uncharacterized protein n=1 Tax=Meloidogyne enterolobii TaxID=390850 RepID=A0A6V7UAP2_MELEN|nr:unnamed protein product [Meloidogyne enterolobii]
MEDNEATLILLLQCPIDMALEIINSYRKDNKLKNMILVESAIQHEYERNEAERGNIINIIKANKT